MLVEVILSDRKRWVEYLDATRGMVVDNTNRSTVTADLSSDVFAGHLTVDTLQ